LGLVLLATFVVAGRGLAASGAMARVVAAGVRSAAPEHAAGNAFYEVAGASADEDGGRGAWLLVEVLGIALGGLVSAAAAGRLRAEVARGPRMTNRTRLVWAAGGGALMGFGARLARGCTSGHALTGGAQLNLGSWAFMLALFAGGYAAMRLARRGWT
jgi:uncharacterized membrane protein YedE/YeeE